MLNQTWPLRADGRMTHWPQVPKGQEALFDRLRSVCEEGLEAWDRFQATRGGDWHSFVPAAYDSVLTALLEIRQRRGPEGGGRFLELGSGIGVVAIMADLLGFEAYGIEIAPDLVETARSLAKRFDSNAHFAAGSYLPHGYTFAAANGDTRTGSLGIGRPAYAELGRKLDEFDWVYVYPWPGEAEVARDLLRRRGSATSHLLLHGYTGKLELLPAR